MSMGSTEYSESLKLVMLGKTGTGKSTFINFIMGGKQATSKHGRVRAREGRTGRSCTQGVRYRRSEFLGQPVVMMDTPGLLDSDNPGAIKKVVERNVTKAAGAHCLCIMLNSQESTYDKALQDVVDDYIDIFGREAMNGHLCVVLTKWAEDGRTRQKREEGDELTRNQREEHVHRDFRDKHKMEVSHVLFIDSKTPFPGERYFDQEEFDIHMNSVERFIRWARNRPKIPSKAFRTLNVAQQQHYYIRSHLLEDMDCYYKVLHTSYGVVLSRKRISGAGTVGAFIFGGGLQRREVKVTIYGESMASAVKNLFFHNVKVILRDVFDALEKHHLYLVENTGRRRVDSSWIPFIQHKTEISMEASVREYVPESGNWVDTSAYVKEDDE